jgi:DNA-directed RNA polymerase subunit RPC12/RpoP
MPWTCYVTKERWIKSILTKRGHYRCYICGYEFKPGDVVWRNSKSKRQYRCNTCYRRMWPKQKQKQKPKPKPKPEPPRVGVKPLILPLQESDGREEKVVCMLPHFPGEECPECCGHVFGVEECEFCSWRDICEEKLRKHAARWLGLY